MKKILFLFILIFPCIAFAQQELSWDFPVKPGSEEWKQLNTYQDKLNAFNLPQEILERISTEKLAEACLNYPLFSLIFTRNDLQRGYNHVRAIFNGFRELELRDDAGKELLKIYKNYEPEDFKKTASLAEIGSHVFKFTYIEILLAQFDMLNSLNDNGTRELLQECERIYSGKKRQIEHYGYYGLKTTALLVARSHREVLSGTVSRFGEDNFNVFIKNAIITEPAMIDEILSEYKSKTK
ncbi:MAG: hypothetical protein ACP5E3_05675 [Bacteroidales bacterium]